MGAGDQREQLPRDRVGGRRALQTAAEVSQCPGPVAPLDGDGSQVE
jgi:hypothetical protein